MNGPKFLLFYKELLKYYDDFNDFNSSVRIVDEIEKL